MTALHSFFASLQGEHIEKLDSWTGNIIGEPMSTCDSYQLCDFCQDDCDVEYPECCDCDDACQ
jgi:hypothetical protein